MCWVEKLQTPANSVGAGTGDGHLYCDWSHDWRWTVERLDLTSLDWSRRCLYDPCWVIKMVGEQDGQFRRSKHIPVAASIGGQVDLPLQTRDTGKGDMRVSEVI